MAKGEEATSSPPQLVGKATNSASSDVLSDVDYQLISQTVDETTSRSTVTFVRAYSAGSGTVLAEVDRP